MKTIIGCIEGFSASLRKDEVTTSHVVEEIIEELGMGRMLDTWDEFLEFKSVSMKVIQEVKEWMESFDPKECNLCLIGKSMGGGRLERIYRKHFNLIKSFHSVSIMFIDAHEPIFQFNSWRLVPLGPYRKINIKKTASNIWIGNVFQRDKYPRGADIKGHFKYNKKIEDTDHFKIIFNEVTKRMLTKGIKRASL